MPIFEVIEPVAGAPAPPGPWASRPAPVASFSAGAAPTERAQIWCANLPADATAARAELAAAVDGLRSQEAALARAEDRMQRAARGGASFAAGAMPAPEQELLLVLEDLRRPAGGASFSAGQAEGASWQQAQTEFSAFATQVHEALRNYAVVETRVAAVLVGRTSVGWGGDVRSLISSGLAADQAELHRRTLALALGSRAAMLRAFATVTRGAAIIATAVSSPVGPLLALPAAWKFVDQLLRDLRGGQQE